MNRRRLLRSLAGLAAVGLGGCVATEPDRPTTASPVASALVESGTGPFPHDVEVYNRGDGDAAVTVRVRRDDELLYQETHSVPPADTGRTVAGITEETLPAERRTLEVSLTHAGRTESVTVRVSDCLGGVFGTVGGSDGLDLTYSIC